MDPPGALPPRAQPWLEAFPALIAAPPGGFVPPPLGPPAFGGTAPPAPPVPPPAVVSIGAPFASSATPPKVPKGDSQILTLVPAGGVEPPEGAGSPGAIEGAPVGAGAPTATGGPLGC